MKTLPLFHAAVVLLLLPFNSLLADAFGVGTNRFDIEFVAIGNPGNPADPQVQFTDKEQEVEDLYDYDSSGNYVLVRKGKIFSPQFAPGKFGAVGYEFRMGKFEVSRDMVLKANRAGNLGITLQEIAPSGQRQPNDQPATGISWLEAARFVNWLNTSKGYAPAYKFRFQPWQLGYNANFEPIQQWAKNDPGFDAANPYRNLRAAYFLPNENEWYKAAYYDPAKGIYYAYATASDAQPIPVANGTQQGTAVYLPFLGKIARPNTQTQITAAQITPASVFLAGGSGPYGTIGQNGNALEWSESFFLPELGSEGPRSLRGGPWSRVNLAEPRFAALNGMQLLRVGGVRDFSSATRLSGAPSSTTFSRGLRVAGSPLEAASKPVTIPVVPSPPSPGADFLSPLFVPNDVGVEGAYRDSAGGFVLGIEPRWQSVAVSKEVDVKVVPLSRSKVFYTEDDTAAADYETLIGDIRSSTVPMPVTGALVEFDIDGDKVYDVTRKTDETLSVSEDNITNALVIKTRRLPQKMGAHRIRARWLAPSGEWIVAESRVYVGMEPGISIADGAEFTNRLKSKVYLFPPIGSAGAVVSNDGGFRGKSQVLEFDEVKEPGEPIELSWDLPKADNQRSTRVVYVRYVNSAGRAMKGESYSDDIIFDTVPPRVLEATLSDQPGRKAAVQITLQLKAQDNRSKVARLQVARGERRQGRIDTFSYSARRNIPRAGGAVWLRVQDGAGNWSVWTKPKVRAK